MAQVFNTNPWPVYLDDGRVLAGNEWTELSAGDVPVRDDVIVAKTKAKSSTNMDKPSTATKSTETEESK